MNETISDIEEVVKVVLFRNAALSDRISTLEAERLSLEAENASLELEKASLEAENKKF